MYWYLSFRTDLNDAKTPGEARRALADIESFASDAIDEMSNRQAFHIAASAIAALADFSWKTEMEVKAVPTMREIFDRFCARMNDVIVECDMAETMLGKPKSETDEEDGEDE